MEFDEEIKEIDKISKILNKFNKCMLSENEDIQYIMPLNLGDMLTKKSDFPGNEGTSISDENYFDFDIFDRFDKNGKEKLTKEQIEKINKFQKLKYCISESGIDKL